MCSTSMCAIQVNKVDLKPTTYYMLTNINTKATPSEGMRENSNYLIIYYFGFCEF